MLDQYLVPTRSVGGTKRLKGFNTMKEENRCHEMLRCSSKVRFEINLNGFHKGADKVEKKKKIIIQST